MALGGIEEGADEGEFALHVLVDLLGPGIEGVGQAVDFGNGHGGHHADDVGLGHLAGDHARQVGRFVNPVVEHAEIGLGRTDARAEDEGHVRVVAGHPAGDALGAEGVAGDQLVALFGILTHDAGEIGGFDALRIVVDDPQFVLGLEQGHVNLVDPGLLDGGLEDRRHLQRLGRHGRGHDADHHGHRQKQHRHTEPLYHPVASLHSNSFHVFCL